MVVGDTRQAIAQLGVAPDAQGGLVLSALLPLGLSIPAGVRVAVGERDEMSLELMRCVPAGCIAAHALTADEIAALRSDTEITIRFDPDPGRTITLTGSLHGITAGLDATGWDR